MMKFASSTSASQTRVMMKMRALNLKRATGTLIGKQKQSLGNASSTTAVCALNQKFAFIRLTKRQEKGVPGVLMIRVPAKTRVSQVKNVPLMTTVTSNAKLIYVERASSASIACLVMARMNALKTFVLQTAPALICNTAFKAFLKQNAMTLRAMRDLPRIFALTRVSRAVPL
jgi:hypothetical protein